MSKIHQCRIDGAKTRTLRSFYTKIAKQLKFHAEFGRNLDALFDALCDLEGVEAQEVELTIVQSNLFLDKEKAEKRAAALQVLQDATVAENRYDERSFKVILA
jgi:RNAse (barnase) inhibitor barstar